MTKMAAMPIYGKTHLRFSSPEPYVMVPKDLNWKKGKTVHLAKTVVFHEMKVGLI